MNDDDRRVYLEHVSTHVHALQALYAKLSRIRSETPEGFRQRMEVGEKIQDLVLSATPEERTEYGIW